MIAGVGPYPQYEPAEAAGLEVLPATWNRRRLKALFREVDHRSKTGEEKLLSLRMHRGLVGHIEAGGKPIEAEALIGFKKTTPGQLVMNRMRAAAGLFAVTPEPGMVSPDYAVFDVIGQVNCAYYLSLFQTPMMKAVFRAESKGLGTGDAGFLRLYTDRFGVISVPVPPPDEQAAIVKFIDYADRRIRRYIRAKQKLIKLLEEQKQAIIHQAVTRGLDPNVRLKPSGVEWLGDVPEHWALVPLKYLCRRIQNGATPPSAEHRYYEGGDVPWYGPASCAEVDAVGRAVRFLTRTAIDEGKARRIVGPALLIVVIGATAGRMTMLDHEGTTNQQITAHELSESRMNALFCTRQLQFAGGWLRGTASTATIPILDSSLVARLTVAVPSLEEQQAVVASVDAALAPVKAAIGRAHSEVELLQEYRTRLISDVVAGKLDVRQAAAALPDEVEDDATELEQTDDDLDDEADLPDEDTDA